MKPGFYTIMAAQFFSSLADNALLIAAIALLVDLDAPDAVTPMLKFFFTVSYVLLAAFVGAFADSRPKGTVMFLTNTIKIGGCLLMILSEFISIPGTEDYFMVLVAYGLVGLGAAAYSPAKYGILTELLPPEKLVVANGWIEGLTVTSIILGTVLGGALISPKVADFLLSIDLPHIDTGIDSAPGAAMIVIGFCYVMAAIFNLFIPDTGVRYKKQSTSPTVLLRDFSHCLVVLWKDKLGQISLAVTTLFWGAGATLQFIVLKWSAQQLGLPLDKGAILQGVVAVGIAIGAILAARFVPLKKSISVLPYGVVMGIVVMMMVFVENKYVAYPLLIIVGSMAGYFVVPMNALLQHRGHVLMSAGHSIAVQNFNENLNILIMLTLYAMMIRANMNINTVIIIFGMFVSGMMLLVMYWNRVNQRREDLSHLIGSEGHGGH
jgi:MFS family permease